MSLDYLIVGHVTRDLLPGGGFTIGGTVTYAARTALALGCRVRVVTSATLDLDLTLPLAGCQVVRRPAEATTTFENIYLPQGRRQILHARADPLGLDTVPPRWRRPDVLHLAPLTDECHPALVGAFPDAFIGVTPQGWMRTWDDAGRVSVGDWTGAEDVLPRIHAAVLSREDVGGDRTLLDRLVSLAPTVAVTLGKRGCRVHAGDEMRRVPVTPVAEVDATGAGDIFAATFFVHLHRGRDPWTAADFANRVAALSVARVGWSGTPTRQEIAAMVSDG